MLAVLVLCGVVATLWQVYVPQKAEESAQMVETIKNARLTVADADGSNLPPKPDVAAADATVEGIDTNSNGIRDEVELAIFAKYPGPENLKLRAAALQYATALQMYLTSVFSKETLVAVSWQKSRGYFCVSASIPAKPGPGALDSEWKIFDAILREADQFVRVETLDTKSRTDKFEEVFEKYMMSHGSPDGNYCDLVW